MAGRHSGGQDGAEVEAYIGAITGSGEERDALVQARPSDLGLRSLQGHVSLHGCQLRVRLRHIAGAPKADSLRELS